MKKIITSLFLTASLLVSLPCTVSAAENKILKSTYTDGVLDMYVSLESDMELSSVTAGDTVISSPECSRPGEAEPVMTTFFVDSYACSDADNFDLYRQMIRYFLSSSNENESFRLVSFGGSHINTETGYTKNQMQVLDAAEKIKPSSEMPDLYSVTETFYRTDKPEPEVFERLIVFTDCETVNDAMFSDSDNETFIPPLYFVVSGDSSEMLYSENLTDMNNFQELYRCSPENDCSITASMINNMSGIKHIRAELGKEAVGDGGLKRISLGFEGEGISAVLEETIDTGDCRYESQVKYAGMLKVMIVIISMIALVLAFFLVYVLRKNKKQVSVQSVSVSETEKPHYTTPLPKKKNTLSTILSTVSTRVLFKESSKSKVILTEIGNPDRRIEISSEKEAVIGRNQSMADCVIYNERSVSQQHCRVYSRNSKIYVEDLGSLNHTYVDGEEITGETELFTGAVLKIGRVVFDVRIVTI